MERRNIRNEGMWGGRKGGNRKEGRRVESLHNPRDASADMNIGPCIF